MAFIVTWTRYAKVSYFEEINYIDRKWTSREVEGFILLVEDLIQHLSSGVLQGKGYSNDQVYSVVISKQTTLFFKKYIQENTITLLLFWNNQRNPRKLEKLLK